MPGEDPKLHLFGQLKRITKQWLDTCLKCARAARIPRSSCLQELWRTWRANASRRHHVQSILGTRPIKALLDPYNPTGSTAHVRFNTSKTLRWQTRADRCATG
jgi:type III restriction enzyme